MKTIKEIPEGVVQRLIELLGYEKAINYIEKENSNYIAVLLKIFELEIKGLYKKSSFIFIIIVLLIIVFIIYALLKLFSY